MWSPRQLGELTLGQLSCLVHERAPESGTELATAADWLEFVAARKREDEEWASSSPNCS